MKLLRPLLVPTLLALAAACLPASARHADPSPSGVPGVTDAQLSSAYWVARLPNADEVMLDGPTIASLNATLERIDTSMHDIRHLPAALPRAQVRAWTDLVSKRPTRSLYDADGHPVSPTDIDAILANDALDAIPDSVTPRYGMAIRRAGLRSHATERRVFSRVGDTDIDRFQESTLFPGDPVVVVHASRDGKWSFIVSPRYISWVRSDDIAIGDASQVFAHVDAVPYRVITGAKPRTVFTPEAPAVSETQLDMGTRVPLDTSVPSDAPVNGQGTYGTWVLSLPLRDAQGALAFQPALLPRNDESSADYLPLTRANIVRQAFRFLGERYGWGHAFNGRDCSGFVSDVYRSMGVQMPRNTGDQANSPAFNRTAYSGKDSHETRVAAAMAMDVGDLIYIPGHVMMVIGKVDGQPYVIHDVGGISYRDASGTMRRIALNEVAVTPLLPLMFNERESFVDRMTAIVRIRTSRPRAD
jgi:cell wall-associated NlpC family hydrolase